MFFVVWWLGPAFAQDPAEPSAPEAQTEAAEAVSDAPVNVRGFVSDFTTGEPLAKVRVRMEGFADAGVLTDGEGRFAFRAVPSGRRRVRLSKPGYHDGGPGSDDGMYPLDGPAHSVLVMAGMPDMSFQLKPNGSIHGYVELTSGEAASDIPVTLVTRVARNGRAVWTQSGSTRTDGAGSYRFPGLPNGVYEVYTQPALEPEAAVAEGAAKPAANRARNGYPSVYYPDAHEFGSAMPIRISMAEQAQANLHLAVVPFQSVTASAFLPDGRKFVPKTTMETGPQSTVLSFLVMDTDGQRLPYAGSYDEATHMFRMALPDGAYTLMLEVLSEEKTTELPKDGAEKQGGQEGIFAGFVDFSVDGQAVNELHIPLLPASGWPIRMHAIRSLAGSFDAGWSESRLQGSVTVTAFPARAIAPGGEEEVTAENNGRGRQEFVPKGAGEFWIKVQVSATTMCVDSLNAGETNLARVPLHMNPTANPTTLDLTLRDDCATLILDLPLALEAYPQGEEPFYNVYVVPEFDTAADIAPLSVHPSASSPLTLQGLTPGNYRIFVMNAPSHLEYRNPAALASLPSHGQEVMLSPGATSHLVLEVPER